jgi:hypothetical protein
MLSSPSRYILLLDTLQEKEIFSIIFYSDTLAFQAAYNWMICLEQGNARVQLVLLDSVLAKRGELSSDCF